MNESLTLLFILNRLGMNQIIDISDISEGSHLNLFSPFQQQQIIKKLLLPETQTNSNNEILKFDNIIDKLFIKKILII